MKPENHTIRQLEKDLEAETRPEVRDAIAYAIAAHKTALRYGAGRKTQKNLANGKTGESDAKDIRPA